MSNFSFFIWQSCTMCWPVVVNDWALDGSSLRPRPICGQPWALASQSPCPWLVPLWAFTPLVPLLSAVVSKLLGSRPRTWFLSFSARPWLFTVLLSLLCSPDKLNSSRWVFLSKRRIEKVSFSRIYFALFFIGHDRCCALPKLVRRIRNVWSRSDYRSGEPGLWHLRWPSRIRSCLGWRCRLYLVCQDPDCRDLW